MLRCVLSFSQRKARYSSISEREESLNLVNMLAVRVEKKNIYIYICMINRRKIIIKISHGELRCKNLFCYSILCSFQKIYTFRNSEIYH